MSKPVTPTLVVAAAPLLDALATVIVAAARDDKRPILSSVLFEVGTARKPSLKLVACDNYRIASAEVPLTGVPADASITITGAATTFVMPLADAKALIGALKAPAALKYPVPVKIVWPATSGAAIVSSDITFDLGRAALTFRPIDGTYPNYAAVLPKGKPAYTIAVSATYLAELVKALTAGGKPANGHGGNGSDTVLIEVRKPAKGATGFAASPLALAILAHGPDGKGKSATLMQVRVNGTNA